MDWATLDPVITALAGVIVAIITTGGAIVVAKRRNNPPGQQAELAAVTIDSTAVKQLAAAVEALGVTLREQGHKDRDRTQRSEALLEALVKVLDEVKDEIRHQGEALRK